MASAAGEDGNGKRRRRVTVADEGFLQRLLNIGGASNSSLRRILEQVQAHPGDLDFSIRQALEGAYHTRFEEVAVSIELPFKNGGAWTWEFADPCLLLSAMVRGNVALQVVYASAIRTSRPTADNPWHLILAWDEFVPGDKLHCDNRRKSMVLSFSFRELGQAALCHDWAWCTPVVVRTTTISQTRGGWSSLLGHYIRRQLFGPHGLLSAGVPLDIQGSTVLLFAKIGNLLSDGEGFQKALCWKGASGLKPCFLHDNIFKKTASFLIDALAFMK